MASVRNQQNRLWNRLKILYSIFLFLGWIIRFLLLTTSKATLKRLSGRVRIQFLWFGIYCFTLKNFLSWNKKTPEKSGVFGVGSKLIHNFGAVGGIRTHVPQGASWFRVMSVMTTSIPLHKITITLYHKEITKSIVK